jgi:hypothetical protein
MTAWESLRRHKSGDARIFELYPKDQTVLPHEASRYISEHFRERYPELPNIIAMPEDPATVDV